MPWPDAKPAVPVPAGAWAFAGASIVLILATRVVARFVFRRTGVAIHESVVFVVALAVLAAIHGRVTYHATARRTLLSAAFAAAGGVLLTATVLRFFFVRL
jgi:hypothetical protein